MQKEFLMGNQAIALGAIRAGVGVVSGYPGTPSTEVLETIAKYNPGDIYVEWSVNEKAALEVAAGAAYTGKRTMVTMKQVGLNVASDPLMSLAYIGIKGGMVVMTADDPGPISSQTEQDTRYFAGFAKLPVFDPSSPEEAYEMIQDAFEYSEKYHTPVFFRPTTRICHGCSVVDTDQERKQVKAEGFVKDSKWVIFPRLAYQNHIMIENRNSLIGEDFCSYRFNTLWGNGKKGIVTHGISYGYVKEALELLGVTEDEVRLLKISTPYPFPDALAVDFLKDADEVIAIEELEPVIEKQLVYLCGKHGIRVPVYGKLTKNVAAAGENSVDTVKTVLAGFLGKEVPKPAAVPTNIPPLPVRPPVLCAGCPHRAAFYAVKRAMKGRKAVFSGDIGCYTLGNASPLDMVDTCLCMGAGVTVAQGLHRGEPDAVNFAFIGDSTFFHTGIPGVINAVYNGTDIVLVILDNSTTAMTGHQPHPGTGVTMMGDVAERISIPRVLEGIGVTSIKTVNPFHLAEAIETAKAAADVKGVSAVIFKAPCIAVVKPLPPLKINENCINCKLCIREIGCPAIGKAEKAVKIDAMLCDGCGLCTQICPKQAISSEGGL